MSTDETEYQIQIKTRKRSGKDLRHSDLGPAVVQIVITAQTTNVLGTILNSLVTETRDYRSTHARILLQQLAARTAIKTALGARP